MYAREKCLHRERRLHETPRRLYFKQQRGLRGDELRLFEREPERKRAADKEERQPQRRKKEREGERERDRAWHKHECYEQKYETDDEERPRLEPDTGLTGKFLSEFLELVKER